MTTSSDDERTTAGASGATRTPGREALSKPLPKRFYTSVAIGREGPDFTILLDGRTARTPGKAKLDMPSAELAAAIAAEWGAQGERIDPAAMPLTRLLNTAIDGVGPRRAEVAADVVKYAGSDLLCYRADHPRELADRQAMQWDPILTWAHEALGARFFLAEGIMPVTQPANTLARLGDAVSVLDPLRLTSLHVMTTLTGSALLALAVERRRLTVFDAWLAAHVDEDYQIELWGEDAEAAARRAGRLAEMSSAARLLDLLHTAPPDPAS